MEGLRWEEVEEASHRVGLSLAPARVGLLVPPPQHSSLFFAPLETWYKRTSGKRDLFARLQPVNTLSLLAVEAPLLLRAEVPLPLPGEVPPLLLVEFLPPGCCTFP